MIEFTSMIQDALRGVYLYLIFEMSIWEFITDSKKIAFESNLIFTACVAYKNQFRNQIDF